MVLLLVDSKTWRQFLKPYVWDKTDFTLVKEAEKRSRIALF